jgi:transposase
MSRKAAAIDVGSEKMHVGIDRQAEVRVFECFTDSLHQLRDYLLERQVTTVAMEATGVYWLPVFDILEAAGLEVLVVNGAHVKNVPGRKTDVQDCQWLAQLHGQGLLQAGFVPPAKIRKLRSYVRLRQEHVTHGAQHILHMQKALDLMNIKIHDVLSQTIGVSCLRMIRAIIGGQRNPVALLALCDVDVQRRKSKDLLRALEGNWDQEHLFALGQALQGWDFYQGQIAACDKQIERLLAALAAEKPQPPSTEKPTIKKRRGNTPEIDEMEQFLHRLTGADLSALPCLTAYSQLLLLAEVGTDMSRWPTHKHFTSWLGLAPGSRQSGKRRRVQKRFRGAAGKIFAVIARTIGRSKYLAISGFYRRLKAKRGAQVANIACARKLAILFYNALRHGIKYVEQGLEKYEQQYKERTLKGLARAAARFGYTLTTQTVP